MSKAVIALGPFTVTGTGDPQLVTTFSVPGFCEGMLIVDVASGSSPGVNYEFSVVPMDPQSGNITDPNHSIGQDGGTLAPDVMSGNLTAYMVMPSLFSTHYALQVRIAHLGTITFSATVIALD